MTLQLDLRPDVEAALARQAAERGLDVPAYATRLLEEAAQPPVPESQPGTVAAGTRPTDHKSLAQLFAESPFRGLDMEFERSPDLGRDIEL